MENIRYGRLDATDEECILAAKMADADYFIRQLPDGYHTILSERGGNLSQGQRQLLAISRAILADPDILILDEATIQCGYPHRSRIQKALLKLMEGRTSFVIAHRLSTIRDADKVLVINEGEIIEDGTHDQLLAQKGFFHNLYQASSKASRSKNRLIGHGFLLSVFSTKRIPDLSLFSNYRNNVILLAKSCSSHS